MPHATSFLNSETIRALFVCFCVHHNHRHVYITVCLFICLLGKYFLPQQFFVFCSEMNRTEQAYENRRLDTALAALQHVQDHVSRMFVRSSEGKAKYNRDKLARVTRL